MSTNVPLKAPPEPGGFALIPMGLVKIWWLLPEHFTRLLPALLSFRSTDSGTCFPSQETLAALVRRGRKAVWSAINQMEQVGLIQKVHRADPRRRNANTSCSYSLANLDDPAVLLAVSSKVTQLRGSGCVVQGDTARSASARSSCVAQDDSGHVSS